jgi:FixJ family two-component response regulator
VSFSGVDSSAATSLVCVVDDDDSVRESLTALLKEQGFEARGFASAEAFLASDCIDAAKCLLLDVAMPGMSGIDLQRELRRRQLNISIIFITGGDQRMRAQAMDAGAVAFLDKPFDDAVLLKLVRTALKVA